VASAAGAALRVVCIGCIAGTKLDGECRSNLHVTTGDAAAHVAERVRQGAQPLDAVFLDAFDGDDNVPQSLCSPGRSRQPRLWHLLAVMHIVHEACVFKRPSCPCPSYGRLMQCSVPGPSASSASGRRHDNKHLIAEYKLARCNIVGCWHGGPSSWPALTEFSEVEPMAQAALSWATSPRRCTRGTARWS